MNTQILLAATADKELNMVTIITLVILFAALLIASVFYAMGKRAGASKAACNPTAAPAMICMPAAPTVTETPEEVIAVITAAIAAMSQADGKQYAIRRIRPAVTAGTRSAWAAAGIAENTHPF